ncbi:MAG: glycosyltransferase family 9 protein, partial [Deltaproteobacteria bacterium]|nr:glycosyltransferase family 9 protein [Deltaproteobacteria bacterium]
MSRVLKGYSILSLERQIVGSSDGLKMLSENCSHFHTKNINNILLIQLGDIGDVVLTFPCIRALRENFPEANLIVAVREKAGELIEDCPWADGVISVNKQKRGLATQIAYQKGFFLSLRKFHFDLTIDMRTGTRGAILAFLSGARQRIGYHSMNGKLWRNRIFTHLYVNEYNPLQHVAEYHLNLLAAYGLTTENIWPEIHIPHERQQQAESLFGQEKITLG